jgi:cytochrome c553
VLLLASSGTPAAGSQTADIGQGQKRAAVCFACHGEDGISQIPGTPSLAGQDRNYLETALYAYRGGQKRQDPTMNAMAQPLSDSDIINIAAYFSEMVPMYAGGQKRVEVIATNERLNDLPAKAGRLFWAWKAR